MTKLLVPLNQFNEVLEPYETIPQDSLIVFTAYKLENNKIALTYENIVALAFTLFPKRFSLRSYTHWPDSTVINKSWLRCRTDKKWLRGTAKAGFILTDLGMAEAIKLEENWNSSNKIKTVNRKLDFRTQTAVKEFRKSIAFTRWLDTKIIDFHVSELLLALHCTMSSNYKIKQQRLKEMVTYAEAASDIEMIQFLMTCEKKFQSVFYPPNITNSKGGMNKRKGR